MIHVRNTQRKIATDTQKIKSNAQKLLDLLGYSNFDLSILITTNNVIKRYNKQFRNIDKPTDILSFPFYPNLKPGKKISAKIADEQNLGDIIISAERAYTDAQELGLSFELRLRVLLVHGICHLLGYDHITERDYKRMSTQEEKLLKLF